MRDKYEDAIEALVKGDSGELNTISEETGKTALAVYTKWIKGRDLSAIIAPMTVFSHGQDTFVFKFEVPAYEEIPPRVIYLNCMDTRISFIVFHANERVFSCSFDLENSWYNIETLLMILMNEYRSD